MEIKLRAYVYLIASLLIGSLTPALLLLTRGASAFELFFLAALISIPIGLLLVIKNKKTSALTSLLTNRKKLLYVVLAAVLTYVPYEYGIAYAEHFISASLVTVLFRFNPLLMLLFIPVLLRERLSRKQVLALAIAFIGILIGVGGGGVPGITGGADFPIVLFTLMLALGYAFATVIIKWQMVDNDLFLSISAIALAVLFGTLFFGTGMHASPMNFINLGIILWLAVTNIFSFYMYIHALKVLKTTVVTNTFLLSPFLTFVWAFVLFAQPIKVYYLAIAALVSLGIIVQKGDVIGGSYASGNRKSNRYPFVMFDVTGAFIGSGEQRIDNLIRGGGRVIATKLKKTQFDYIAPTNYDLGFENVYTGQEASIAKEARFVRNILGVDEGEMTLIKAGPNAENDRFFEELNNRLISRK